VLQGVVASQKNTVTSAIKTMPYSAIEGALHAIGLGQETNVDPSWTPVPLSSLVDVAVVGGRINPPGATNTYNWMAVIVNPHSGQIIAESASNDGTWPAFFGALPDSSS
jgi:hypothetical protein